MYLIATRTNNYLSGSVSDDIVCKQLKCMHPSAMVSAGPSHSVKTHWVIYLLASMNTRIKPTHMSITYCDMNWQDKYECMGKNIPSVLFYDGFPSITYFNNLSDAIFVFHDRMEASIGNQNMMNRLIPNSIHRYMILFKNALDRPQIKTLAMYPKSGKIF